jgi:hypothetical protein
VTAAEREGDIGAAWEAKGEGIRGASRVIGMADPARDEDANDFQGRCYEAGASFIITYFTNPTD